MKLLTTLFIILTTSVQVLFAQSDINKFDQNGKRHGQWEKKYPSGKVRYRGQFSHGRETGFFYFYSESNQSKPYIVKDFTEGNSIAIVKFYSNYGLLESEGKMLGKKRIGKWLYYGTNGRIIVLEEDYKNGVLHGERKIFYPDGTLTEVSHYKNGKRNGESLRYTNTGNLVSKLNYREGELHGDIVYNNNDGVIREKGQYYKGIRYGRWEFYVDGELAGIDEPREFNPQDTIKMEDLRKRIALKKQKIEDAKKEPKKVFTLAELQKRKTKAKPKKKAIPKKKYTLEEIQARKEKRNPKKKVIPKKVYSLEEIQARKKKREKPIKEIPKKIFTLEEIQARKKTK